SLSVFSRAYLITNEQKYLQAGNKALKFLNVPKESGGPRTTLADLHPSLKGRLFYMEYPTDPTVYTLNGFMFTLIGLYDWWKTTGNSDARFQFYDGMETLLKILPYYDLGTFTSYDLSYITQNRPPWLVPLEAH